MSDFSLEIIAANEYDLNETLDLILDGELDKFASYDDIATEQGVASLLGMGERPTIKIIIKFKDDPNEPQLPEKLLRKIEELLGPKGTVQVQLN